MLRYRTAHSKRAIARLMKLKIWTKSDSMFFVQETDGQILSKGLDIILK